VGEKIEIISFLILDLGSNEFTFLTISFHTSFHSAMMEEENIGSFSLKDIVLKREGRTVGLKRVGGIGEGIDERGRCPISQSFSPTLFSSQMPLNPSSKLLGERNPRITRTILLDGCSNCLTSLIHNLLV
jgi:hypothetical protein